MLKKIFTILAFTLLICSTAYCFEPLDTDAVTSLEIKYKYDTVNISGAEFKLYKVAEVSKFVSYTATSQFSKYAISFDDIKSDGGRALATTLAGYTVADKLTPVAAGTTDSNGVTKFSNLTAGLYLATSPSHTYNGYVYTPEPVFVCLPNYSDDKWVNDVTASPKVSRTNAPSSSGGGHIPDRRIEIGVLVVWENDNEETRPKNVEVELYKDDLLYNSRNVGTNDSWHHTWPNLPEYGDYNVVEKTVPEGYTVSITREGNVFIITHTAIETTTAEPPVEVTTAVSSEKSTSEEPQPTPPTPPVIQEPVVPENTEAVTEDPLSSLFGRGGRTGAGTSRDGEDDDDTPNVPGLSGSAGGTGSRTGAATSGLPQTGQLQWPVPIMATIGLILFLLGFIRHKEQDIKLKAQQ